MCIRDSYDRILDSKSKVLVTCDGAWLRGEVVELKKIVNEALELSLIHIWSSAW